MLDQQSIIVHLLDKIRPYQDKKTKKQEEREPWLIRKNEKEAAIKVRVGEREDLVGKAERVKNEAATAEQNFKELQEVHEEKVSFTILSSKRF